MKIKSLILENFRSYKDRTEIPFSQLTGFIGRNDIGKSTILEALDIFFDGGVVKIDRNDANIHGNPENVRICVIFDDLPKKLVLDTRVFTTLEDEYLLNADGCLEIHKVFDCALQSPKLSIFAYANHPTAPDATDVLQKTRNGLQTLIRKLGLEDSCDQNKNPTMREAIYQSVADLKLQQMEVPLNKDDGKAIWQSLQTYMPLFALFQSDRASSDQDREVQDPMKVAIERALSSLDTELKEITEEIQKQAQQTAQRTLDKLKEGYPEIAANLNLEPKFRDPAWKNLFKLDIESENQIPLNKRGSGIRRLVLLSFFQAEAEDRRKKLLTGESREKHIIYAIEEPETSQHPDYQEKIVRALRELAASGDQVILTTHVPALTSLIPIDGLRFVDIDSKSNAVRVRSGADDENVFQEIADSVGVLPNPLAQQGVKVAVLVEGKTDIFALKSMIEVLVAASVMKPISDEQIFWTIGGGSTLQEWCARKYLDKLGVPIVMIIDSDRKDKKNPICDKKLEWCREMNSRSNTTAFITRKKCIENYLHPEVVDRISKGKIVFSKKTDMDFDDVANEFGNLLRSANAISKTTKLKFSPVDHEGNSIPATVASSKIIICAYLMRHMTDSEISERATYTEGKEKRNEVVEWIEAIRCPLDKS